MSKAIGMVEYKTTSAGVVAADSMVKTSEVSIIEAQTVCPGKYIVIITGDLSAVTSAVDNAKTMHGKHLINSFVLGNPHESIFPAIYGSVIRLIILLCARNGSVITSTFLYGISERRSNALSPKYTFVFISKLFIASFLYSG
jgi:ethanolamine utilization microcompartment shell protein EutL